MKKINNSFQWQTTFIMVGLFATTVLSSCTKKFEEINTNPYGLTENDLKADYKIVGDGFKQIQQNIYISNPAWATQLQQNLIGDVYSGYMMPPTPFRGNSNNINYDLVDGWNGTPWSFAYDNIMAPSKDIQTKAVKDFRDFYAWSQILKVETMHRVSDIFGPIIYTQYGKVNADGSVSYDSQKDAYYAFFKDLKEGIDTLTTYANNPTAAAAKPFANFDLVYGGEYKQWVKFANTLRLRLAIRISKVDPAKAKMEGEAALANTYGLLAVNDDNFNIDIGTNTHPLNVINNSWGDIRMGAPMESVLTGYNDPRLPKYFKPASDAALAGKYKGIRNGIAISDKSVYVGFSPLTDFPNKIQLMTAAEAWFLKAEAALKGWAGAGTSKANYEMGITRSMEQYGLDASTYKTDGTSQPAAYTDPKNAANNVVASDVSKATIKWDDAVSNEQKLEKIITQKWIAMYPDGQEAWSEFRRTGYPKLFTVVVNNSGGKISTANFIRRINFPASEYSTNGKGVADAVTKLGGADNGGTRLWWDLP